MMAHAKSGMLFVLAAVIVMILLFLSNKSVPSGHVGVATLFGSVQPQAFGEGLNFPTNPLYSWQLFDTRQKTHKETALIPSQDQLQTQVELSVQYRIRSSDTPRIYRETGTVDDLVRVHLVPKLRSLLREQGKNVKKAEDFFIERTQEDIQSNLLQGLSDYLVPHGLEVQAVFLREFALPPFIMKAIEAKKEREQALEREKAELERFKTGQEQTVAAAEAQRKAAEADAQRRKLIADARAYEIQTINKALGQEKSYIQLQALETLAEIGKDPSSKIYFLNGDSPAPMPFMQLGEGGKGK